MIRYIFCGNMYTDLNNDIKKMRVPPAVSSHKFQINLIKGLIENGEDVIVINIPRVRYFPHYPQIIFHNKRYSIGNRLEDRNSNIGFINLPLLNYATQQKSLTKAISSIAKSNPDDLFVLMSFNPYLPQCNAMINVRKKIPNIRICAVIGDLHGVNGVKTDGRYDGLKGRIIEHIEKGQDQTLKKCDYFGFLTKYMADVAGVKDKPWTVIEGIYSDDLNETKELSKISNKKTIFYAGAIESEYGLDHLVDSFGMITDSDYVLEIAGSGGYVEYIKERSNQDDRIKYLGFLTPDEVKKHQKNATVLVNPRQSKYEYIKYSFPSKNMECLASGKPYIAHKLSCNPEEYDQFIQYPIDESNEAFARKVMEVCSLDDEERSEIGRRGREFILNCKNPREQVRKIINLINKELVKE